MLATYNDENKGTIKSMLKLFVNSSGLVTYIKDENLFNAIKKEDPELLEILLNPTGSTKFKDVDFVHEDKSLLKMAQDIKNSEMEKLLVDAGAKFTKKEQENIDLVKRNELKKAKEYNYLEDFTNGSTVFTEASNDDRTWSHQNNKFRLHAKNQNRSYRNTGIFNNLDINEFYTVSVKVEKGLFNSISAGLVFDAKDNNYHVFSLEGDIVKLYRFENGNWQLLDEVKVVANKYSNTLKIFKSGNYVYCYLNGKTVISLHKIKSFNGFQLGVISPNPKKNDFVYFDDFKVKGTKK